MIDLICDFDRPSDKQKLYEILKTRKGKQVIQMKQYRKGRSLPQNKYYFRCIVKTLADAFGYFPDEMHEELKRKFNPVQRVNKLTGEIVLFGGSTKEFDTLQAEAYYEAIRTWALTEYDILLPLPNEFLEN